MPDAFGWRRQKHCALNLAAVTLRPGSARQSLVAQATGGKSGLHRAECQITSGSHTGDGVATESAAEKIPPMASFFGKGAQVRVKRCGKSAPRLWQQGWQGKPHSEQDQIGFLWRGPRWNRVGR